ncbi:hypothetical protein SDC9_139501 [bioreactor metagenome]|uniref:Uncharacterized protein n=1 Tax=bioreactor metagenome TaxID=1076179 RepID=A0A645DSR5_9ZZZZ
MLLDACGDGKHVRIKDDVLFPDARSHQKLMTSLCDGNLALIGGSLPLLIKEHHHHGMAMACYLPGMGEEGLFTLLEADGVDDSPALHFTHGTLNDRPV